MLTAGWRRDASTRAVLSKSLQIALLFCLASLLRAIVASRTAVMFDDGPVFVDLAEQMLRGDWAGALSHPYHPLYPFLMAILSPLVGDLETAAIVCSVLGGSLAVVALYLLLRDAFDSQIAWIGALLLAISPYAIRFSSDVEADGIYLGFFLLSVALLWRSIDREGGNPATAGLLAGIAYLARPEGVGIPVVGGLLVAGLFLSHQWSAARSARWLFALWFGFAAAAAPYLVALHSLKGSWTLSNKKSVLQLLGLGESEAFVGGVPLWVLVLAGIVLAASIQFRRLSLWPNSLTFQYPTRFAIMIGAIALVALLAWRDAAWEFVGVLLSSLGPVATLLVLLGIYADRSNMTQLRAVFIGTFLACYAVVLAALLLNYGYLSRRHALPPLTLALGYGAVGVTFIARGLQTAVTRWSRNGRLITRGVALTAVVALVVSSALPKVLRRHRDDALAQRWAAEWLQEQDLPGGGVASERRRIAYYAQREWALLQDRQPLANIDALRNEGVRFIIAPREMDGIADGGTQFRVAEIYRVEERGEIALVYEITDGTSP